MLSNYINSEIELDKIAYMVYGNGNMSCFVDDLLFPI